MNRDLLELDPTDPVCDVVDYANIELTGQKLNSLQLTHVYIDNEENSYGILTL